MTPAEQEPTAAPPRSSASSPRGLLASRRAPIARYRPLAIGAVAVVLVVLVGFAFILGFKGNREAAARPPAGAAGQTDAAPPPDFGPSAASSYADPLAYPSAAPTGAKDPKPAGPLEGAASWLKGAFGRPDLAEAAPTAAAVKPASPSGLIFSGPARTDPPVSAAALRPTPAEAGPEENALPQAASRAKIRRDAQLAPTSADAEDPDAAGGLVRPRSEFELKAGSVIPAALITGIDSELPGETIAQVTENVYDSASGATLLIPQGARLIGRYDNQTVYGQSRVLLTWTRIVLPDGGAIAIGAMGGADPSGKSGLSDAVDAHLPVLIGALGLETLFNLGGAAAANAAASARGNVVIQETAGGVSQGVGQTGRTLADRDLGRRPTLTVRPGFRLTVLLTKDLALEPYGRGRLQAGASGDRARP